MFRMRRPPRDGERLQEFHTRQIQEPHFRRIRRSEIRSMRWGSGAWLDKYSGSVSSEALLGRLLLFGPDRPLPHLRNSIRCISGSSRRPGWKLSASDKSAVLKACQPLKTITASLCISQAVRNGIHARCSGCVPELLTVPGLSLRGRIPSTTTLTTN